MQGSVWGPIQCTASMDKLGELAYKTGKTLYTYNKEVQIPPLGMIDDILAVAECGTNYVVMNLCMLLKCFFLIKFSITKITQDKEKSKRIHCDH